MKLRWLQRNILSLVLSLVFAGTTAYGQIDHVFGNIFSEILDKRLELSPNVHATHFHPASILADSLLTPVLNTLIANNVSSFPLSSTTAGVTFDLSSGQPVSIMESLGPIFAETAEPLGRGKINVGFNYTNLQFSRFRGLPTEDMRFTFNHQLLGTDNTLGQSATESDYIDLYLDLHAKANIYALFATVGVTNDLDLSVALPIIDINISGTAKAIINSYTYARFGLAQHNFGGDSANPIFETNVPYNESATGIGDVAVRVKYSLLRGSGVDFAGFILDVRFPSGDKAKFLGTGKTKVRVSGIFSKKIGDLTPHLNLGYEKRSEDLVSDKIGFTAGFDNKIYSGLTFAFDLLGSIDLDNSKSIKLLPGSVTLEEQGVDPNTLSQTGVAIRQLPLSNIPDRSNDNIFDASFGFRYAPSEQFIFLGNIIVPLNDGGLRAAVATTLGVSATF